MSRKHWLILTFIFVLPLVIGVSYLKWGYIFPVEGDSLYYETLAKNLIQGNGLVDENGAFLHPNVAPGYPVFLSIIYSIFGYNHNAVRFIQFLLLGGIGVLIWLIARDFLKPRLAFLVALTVILWPYFILYSTLILTEILFTFFLVLSIYLLVNLPSLRGGRHRGGREYILLAGASLAIAILIRFTPLLLLFWFVIWGLILKMKKYSIRQMLPVILAFLLIISPWMIYHYMNTLLVPQPFIGGGESYSSVNFFSAETLKSHIEKMPSNILLFWYPGAHGTRAAKIQELYPMARYVMIIFRVFAYLTMLGAAVSLFFERKKTYLLWTTISYFWIVHIIIAAPANPRYILPIMPFIILMAFVSLDNIMIRTTQRKII